MKTERILNYRIISEILVAGARRFQDLDARGSDGQFGELPFLEWQMEEKSFWIESRRSAAILRNTDAMKKEPESDSEKPVRLGIQPAALGYLSLLIVPAVVLGAGKLLDLISGWLR